MGNVKVNFNNFKRQLDKLRQFNSDKMCEDAIKQLGAVYIASAKRNTPVGGNKQAEVSEKAFNASGATLAKTMKEHKALKASGNGGYVKRVGRKKGVKDKVYRIFSSSEHMRRSWQLGAVEKEGNRKFKIPVSNTASYATFVDEGHRQQPGRYVPIIGKRLVNSYVKGLHITDKAMKATNKARVRVLNRVIEDYTKDLKE